MTHVITQPCIGVVDHACVDACPVDCIYDIEDQLVIDPIDCIDCGACVAECPVSAIFQDYDVPQQWEDYIDKNARAFVDRQPVPARPRWQHTASNPPAS